MIVTGAAPVLLFWRWPFSNGRPDVTENDCVRAPAKDAADYIATLAHELASMAASNRLDVLRYLLEMARDEARSVVRGEPEPRDGG